MAASGFESAILGKLFPTGDVGRLFTDSAEVRAMLLVEGTLAKVQGGLSVIPEISAAAIHRAAMEVQIDPGALAEATGTNGVCIPALVSVFRDEMQAPEHAQFIHWGATSQDIIDTGLMLRLRQAIALIETDLKKVLTALSHLAEQHADLPMAARTYGQHATATSFGAQVAEWGVPLLEAVQDLDGVKARFWVSVSGASGTGAAYGDVAATRAGLAEALGLIDPRRSWHTDRKPLLDIADWCVQVLVSLAKIGEDLTSMAQTGLEEINLGGGGGSSTMPQKQNPVIPASLGALSGLASGMRTTLSRPHRHQRDGAAWFSEWLAMPQIVLAAASGVQLTQKIVPGIKPNPKALARAFDSGLIHSEALSFALADIMARPEAQAATKSLAIRAINTETPLKQLAQEAWPDLDIQSIFEPGTQMGDAPNAARAFAAAVRKTLG